MQKALVTELRHEPKRAPDSEGLSRVPRIAIIGGGFAGVATAIKLLDTGTRPLRISIIEPRSEIGRGIAYSTRESAHLVNGPAKLFSLYPERPEHFAQFLARFAGEWNWRDPLSPDFVNAFAPRSVFGDYVRSELARAVARERGVGLGRGGLTLEDLTREILKALIKDWLDQNLPYMIERLVKKEIERMVNRAEKL